MTRGESVIREGTPVGVWAGLLALILLAGATSDAAAAAPLREDVSLPPGGSWSRILPGLAPGRRGELVVSIAAPAEDDRVTVELTIPGAAPLRKDLHAGDPDVYIPCRPLHAGDGAIRLTRSHAGSRETAILVAWSERESDDALEAEPNDDWRSANSLALGRTTYGSADDVDWLENADEGRSGLDWFRFEVASETPVLVTFTMDLAERDVSADLAVFTVRDDRPEPYLVGKDPMEMVHDRERVRYSKNLVRTLTKGTYYLRVNANHPAYALRTRVSGVPPFDDPGEAVAAGLHYLLNAGDAWLAQVPREGNRFVRSANLHETSLRCTGCHATSFPAEAALAARQAGYAIEAKGALSHMMDRIADGPAPLYGGGGLHWQRYIGTPLEAQGAQGSVLLEFDRVIAGGTSAAADRFGPFLEAAWGERRSLPDDEQNVVPAESKFGLARKGWEVLSELGRRTGREDYRRAATNVAAVVGGRTADRRVETLQDRIHRLVAWARIDRDANANKIRREAGALLALQNDDGGWHESDARPGPSAIYATGQLVDALLEAGIPRDHPAIGRAVAYLLARQQDFGGWFQPDTHETFRTPMRETRWAVAALARAHPREAGSSNGWGGRPAEAPRLPRSGPPARTLDDLEGLWDVSPADRPRFARAVAGMLEHESPLVRAAAAGCLGRLGDAEAVTPLVAALDDPSKLVRGAAASALRALGNRGIGVDAVLDALSAPSPRVRREVVGLLTRQVHGFEGRSAFVDRLIELADSPDFLTRFDAARALRRWFYRTNETDLRRRIVEALVARMAVERSPTARRNLSENLYILMDENLGGGVSLQKTLAALPERRRDPALKARRDVERDAILAPILAALRDGDGPQRAGLLRAFDGSFFRGRGYARRPGGAVDVGNDREFGFLHETPLDQSEPVFAALLAETTGADRRRAIQLASFFDVPGRARDVRIRSALLDAMEDPDAETRAEARRIVAEDLSLDGVEDDARLVAAIVAGLAGSPESRTAMIAALGRSPKLARRPEIADAASSLASRPDASAELLPILDRLGLSEAETVAVIARGWDRFDPAGKGRALDAVLRTPPSPASDDLLARASDDPAEGIRERALRARIQRADAIAEAVPAILAALGDESPGLRRLGLAAAGSRGSFWDRADAIERLAGLLVDPDAEVRSDALDVAKHHRLVAHHPALARRVKALIDDPAFADRAEALLRAAGLDPAEVAAEPAPARPRPLDLETFRREIDPLFYRPGPDGLACVDCHAGHAILRIAERREGGPDDEAVALNFASVGKVVDLARPESSPLLTKPRSPREEDDSRRHGGGGTTHVGGVRWDGVDDPAYRAILAWIRTSAARPAPSPGAGTDPPPPSDASPSR